MTDPAPKLWLSWDTYQKNICNGLGLLQQRGEFVDMTIAADGHHVKVHQMIMSLVSPYIKELITSAQCPHPVIFLNRVSYPTLQSILEYAYTGEVMVARDRLVDFLEACKALHIKGLETETIKTSADGALLHLMGAKGEEPEESTQDQEMDLLMPRADKRKRSNEPEEENETLQDDGEMMDDSHFENEQYLEMDNDTNDETIMSDNQQDKTRKLTKSSVLSGNSRSGPSIQYSLSCQGGIQLILNRFLYRMRHARQNNERMWRCSDYDRKACSAFVITKGDTVLERGRAHNHPFHDKQILKRVHTGNLYTAFHAIENVASLNKKLSSAAKS